MESFKKLRQFLPILNKWDEVKFIEENITNTKMKILFLDFDGVLNSLDNKEANYFLWKNNPEHKSKDRFGDLFDQRCINWLSYVIKKTDCKIVISSTWRLTGIRVMEEMWAERNLPGSIVGVTSFIHESYRGVEIADWIRSIVGITVESYCIVDDNNDMLDNQPLVQTDPRFGLDKEAAVKIIAILNK